MAALAPITSGHAVRGAGVAELCCDRDRPLSADVLPLHAHEDAATSYVIESSD